jgi:hypothetical protein
MNTRPADRSRPAGRGGGVTLASQSGAAGLPRADELAPFAVLALRLLADLRAWSAGYGPDVADKPLEAMALSAAAIAPWSDAGALRLAARSAVWLYAVDDLVDVRARSLADVDHVVERCVSVARGGPRDDSHPVFAALCDLQRELEGKPLYGALSALWAQKFESCMRGMRYAWQVGRGELAQPSIGQYLEHADSILKWITVITFWGGTAGPDLPRHLDVLVPGANEASVAIRLANDLATAARERREAVANATSLASPDWIRAELGRRRGRLHRRLGPLLAEGYRPALILTRSVDWAMGFYGLADFRAPAETRGSRQASE